MNEMVERVARAIDEASDEQSLAFMPHAGGPIHPTIEKLRVADHEKRMRQARAAIEAMREPAEAILDALDLASSGWGLREHSKELWQELIDEALK